MPGGKIDCEEEARKRKYREGHPPELAGRVAHGAGDQEQERCGKRDPPEGRCDRSRIGHAHEPGSECKADIAQNQRRNPEAQSGFSP